MSKYQYYVDCETFGNIWAVDSLFNTRDEAQEMLVGCAREFIAERYPSVGRRGLLKIKAPLPEGIDFDRGIYALAVAYCRQHVIKLAKKHAYLPTSQVKKLVEAEFCIRELSGR